VVAPGVHTEELRKSWRISLLLSNSKTASLPNIQRRERS